MPRPHPLRHGFTLVEMAVVLIIIGLLAGGVLVGREALHAAQIRKVINQKERFETATLLFKRRFNCWPGDCPNATRLGFSINGNGDGIIGSWNAFYAYVAHGANESKLFWNHLYDAGLITDPPLPGGPTPTNWNYGGDGMHWGYHSPGCDLCKKESYTYTITANVGGWAMYQTSTWRLSYQYENATYQFTPYGFSPPNYERTFFLLSSPGSQDAMRPRDTYAIDSKMDDGRPMTGNVVDTFYGFPVPAAPGVAGEGTIPASKCADRTNNVYSLTSATADNFCGLPAMRANF